MKTPMQELIKKLKEERSKLQALNERVMVLTLDYAIADAEQMLKKEKEVMVDFAYKFGEEPLSEIPKWYDKQFKTKER